MCCSVIILNGSRFPYECFHGNPGCKSCLQAGLFWYLRTIREPLKPLCASSLFKETETQVLGKTGRNQTNRTEWRRIPKSKTLCAPQPHSPTLHGRFFTPVPTRHLRRGPRQAAQRPLPRRPGRGRAAPGAELGAAAAEGLHGRKASPVA